MTEEVGDVNGTGSGDRGTVVMVEYYFPPLLGIAAERAAAFARHLGELGWRPVVVAPEDGHFHRGAAGPPEGIEVIRTRSPEASRFLRRAYRGRRAPTEGADGTVRGVEAGPVGRTVRRWVRRWLYLPDAQVGWIPFAAAAARRALRRRSPPAVLFSSSVPYSGHLAAWWAARREGRPWVAEFRDPWSTHHPRRRPESALRRRVDRWIEGRILRAADAVVVTSDATRRKVLEGFPGAVDEAGIHVVMNGFEDPPGGTPPGPKAPLRLVYAGTLAPGVDPAPLLAGVAAVEREDAGSVVLRVLGPADAWREAVEAEGEPAPWLETPGMVTPGEARRAMASASANLLVNPAEEYRDVIPGKLFEYLGVRRPVVAAVPPGSEMGELAAGHGDARFVEPYDARRVAGAVRELLREHREGTLQSPRVPRERVAPLHRREQARRLGGVLGSVVREEGR